MKCLYYFVGSRGLGHISRTIRICQGLHQLNNKMLSLIVSGAPMISAFPLPSRTDVIKLPSIIKDLNDLYVPRLGNEMGETLEIRKGILNAAVQTFNPDYFFIDKNLNGICDEMREVLEFIKTSMPQTKIFFNVRDIIDESSKVVLEWNRDRYYELLENYIDHIFIFGNPEIFDLVKEYKFPKSLKQKSTYCGYLPIFQQKNPLPQKEYGLRVAGRSLIC